MLVGFYGHVFRAVNLPGLEGAQIRGGLYRDLIPGIDKNLADQVERLL